MNRRILSTGQRAALGAVLLAAAIVLLLWMVPLGPLHFVLEFCLVAGAVLLLGWLGWRLFRRFLYKVSRRLAFSYFLLGVLPIPMVLLLLGVASYLLASYFIGHLFRDSLQELSLEVELVARHRLDSFARTGQPPSLPPVTPSGIVVAYYRQGRRIAGDDRLPAQWPTWAQPTGDASLAGLGLPLPPRPTATGGVKARAAATERDQPFFTLQPDGPPTLAAALTQGDLGVATLLVDPLDRELSERSGLWVQFDRPDEQGALVNIELGNRIIPFMHARQTANRLAAERFFRDLAEKHDLWDRPMLWWGQMSGPLSELGNGHLLAEHMVATLNGTPRVLTTRLFSTSGEIDAAAWGALLGLAILLLNVYLAAALMAVYMIVGLSRAVNRLSQATDSVRRGDFSVRLQVRRKDQVGDLHRSFNEMTANLEMHVAASTQKELLEKELALARNLQKSLLPRDLPRDHGVDFATLFEPSAAIGGDYFDVLRFSQHELAIIIADVSGHGLSSGLRMAMLKAALLILVEETRDAGEILDRLDRVVRNEHERRYFVTATLGIIDLESGRLRLWNAGHPPTYRIHQGMVDEIMLPGSALGGLGHSYGRAELRLDPGDVVVWLSDGLIEATNAADEPFGYDQIIEALRPERAGMTASAVRDQLLAAIDRHVAGQPPADDRTLVVLRWGSVVRRAEAAVQREASAVRDEAVAVVTGAGGR